MTRENFLKSIVMTGIGLLLAGCGGGQGIVTDNRLKIRILLGSGQTSFDRTTLIDPGVSLLQAIKQVYSYERTAPIEDITQLTIIEGISGHFQYSVNDSIPVDYVDDFIPTTDTLVKLSLL